MNKPLNVLVVDDELAFTKLLALDLEAGGEFSVKTANSGEETLDILQKETFDVILLDYHIDSMTGLEILEWMNEHKSETPVIMLTAAGTEEVAVKAMKLGAFDYIRKERLDLSHLPVVLNGVHERHLYRLEMKQQELNKIEEEKQQAAVQMFQTTVRTIAHHVNNALAVIMLRSTSYEKNVRKNLDATMAEDIIRLIVDLRGQASVIEAVVRSLVELSNVVYTSYVTDQNIIDIKLELEKNLQKMKESHKVAV
jgi:DNA-binding response OmpR family regulator